ncbi:MAG: hypothetical protein JKY30_00050, partial [Flavobacteriales bacterium]|nr:hypothetical protein [Flavobacteriales bacterium]
MSINTLIIRVGLPYFVLFSGLINTVFAQNYPIIFNEKSGLPSNHAYDCTQDKTGKIWITTDNGISAYDGYNFKNYNLSDGLPTLLSWGLTTDSKGRIWLNNRQTPFSYIYNDSIYKVGKSYSNVFCTGIYEDLEGNIYISSLPSNKTHKIDANNKVIEIDSVLLGINTQNEKIWFNHQVILNKKYYILKQKFVTDYVIFYCTEQHTGINYLIIENTITHKKFKLNTEIIKGRLIHFEWFEADKISISAKNKFYILDLSTEKLTPFLNTYSSIFKNPALIYKDENNNLWIPDLKKGIVFMQNLPQKISYTSLNLKEEEITSVSQKKNHSIELTSNLSTIIELKNKTEPTKSNITPKKLNHFIGKYYNKLFMVYDNFIYIVDSSYLFDKKKLSKILKKEPPFYGKLKKGINYKIHFGSYKSHFWEKETIYLNSNDGIYSLSLKNNSLTIEKIYSGYAFSTTTSEKWIYIGTNNGLSRISKKTKKIETLYSGEAITTIINSNSKIISRLINGDILVTEPSTPNIIKKHSHLQYLNKIQLVNDEIWGLSDNKIEQFSANSLKPIFELSNYDGINSLHKISLNKIDKTYYLICNKGFYIFDKTAIKTPLSYNKKHFKIKSISINNKLENKVSNILLNNDENFIRIQLEAFNY